MGEQTGWGSACPVKCRIRAVRKSNVNLWIVAVPHGWFQMRNRDDARFRPYERKVVDAPSAAAI
jgi:hypothetical protein